MMTLRSPAGYRVSTISYSFFRSCLIKQMVKVRSNSECMIISCMPGLLQKWDLAATNPFYIPVLLWGLSLPAHLLHFLSVPLTCSKNEIEKLKQMCRSRNSSKPFLLMIIPRDSRNCFNCAV